MLAKKLLRDWRRWSLTVVRVPDEVIPTALVREKVEIHMVAGSSLPFGNTKAITCLGLLTGAEEDGTLAGKDTLVEATSGNTGKALVAFSPHFAIKNVVLVMEADVPQGKRFPGVIHGAKVLPPEDGLTTIQTARLWGKRKGWLNPDQYRNINGLLLHRLFTGPKIIEALGSAPEGLVAAIGASTTVGGIAQSMRNENVDVVGVILEDNHEAPGMRDGPGMKEIRLPWRSYVGNRIERVQTTESYYASLCLVRATGISFGPTSGSAYIGALKRLNDLRKTGEIDSIRNKKTGKIRVVVVGPDGYEVYGDRYDARVHRKHSRPGMLPLPWVVLSELNRSFSV